MQEDSKESQDISKSEKPNINQIEILKQNTIENLNYLNGLRTPNYNKIISEMCINFNLEDNCLNDNDLNENNIAILSNIYNKINGNPPSKDKKKKNNKGNKDGMGLLLSLDVREPLLLYHPYNKISKNNNIYYDLFLYSIHISTNKEFTNIGFIFPINIGESFKIKLISRRTRLISYAKIKKEKKIQIIEEQMEKNITFHYCICNQLLHGKKKVECDSIKYYMSNLFKNDIFKKYFFVPIEQRGHLVEIDEKKISKCMNYIQDKCPSSIFPRVSEIFSENINSNTSKEEIRKTMFNLFKDCFFVTDYKINRIYKFEDIIFKDDKLNNFIAKYTFNTEELDKELEPILLKSFKDNNLDAKKISAKYIMEDLVFEENIPTEIIGGIVGYRNIPQRYKIEISNKNNYYLSCKFGTLNIIKKVNYTYNTNIVKTNPVKLNKSEYGDNLPNDLDKYAKILPPDRVFCYFLDKTDVELFEIIPSIFLHFEEIIKIPQFIKDYDLLSKKSLKEKKLIEKNYHFLQWAFTLHSYLQDYNYETLETLGDSILKMLSTILVYHIHEVNDNETDVGDLVFNRATLICNLHLLDKGLENKLHSYIIRYPKDITGYAYPLETEFINTGRINVTEKIIADIIESSLGGIFLSTRNTKNCYNYIRQLNIPFVEKDDKKYEQTRGVFARGAIWKNKICYGDLVTKAYENMSKKIENFGEFIYPEKINDVINGTELNQNISLRKLMEKYLLRCNKAKYEFNGDVKSLDYLQECKLFYKFKNIKILEQAMTHKSKSFYFSQNYEKLELLGDSIVESFISQYTFCIFSPYLFEDEDDIELVNKNKKKYLNDDKDELIMKNAKVFNNKYMTHVKSYLCSNYFMCKLSILIGLPKYIRFGENDVNNKYKLTKFLEFNNVTKFFESNLSSYVSTDIYQPKFVADLFEALIGAIYIDSDLKTTYEFLHLIYGPSICYSCLFLQELPFSIVADFTERCSKDLKIVPSFKSVTKDEIINNGIDYDNSKAYLKLSIGELFYCIDSGDSEEKAKENLSEKGIIFLDTLKYNGPSKNN